MLYESELREQGQPFTGQAQWHLGAYLNLFWGHHKPDDSCLLTELSTYRPWIRDVDFTVVCIAYLNQIIKYYFASLLPVVT